MEGKIIAVQQLEVFNDNNVYSVTLDNGTTAKAYIKIGSFNDQRFADGRHIGQKMNYEMSAKGNFSKIYIGDKRPDQPKQSTGSSSLSEKDSMRMSKLACIKAAADACSGSNKDSDYIINMAQRFLDWTTAVPQHNNDFMTRTKPQQVFQEQPPLDLYPQ